MFMMVNLKTMNILKELFMGIISVQKLLSMKVRASECGAGGISVTTLNLNG